MTVTAVLFKYDEPPASARIRVAQAPLALNQAVICFVLWLHV